MTVQQLHDETKKLIDQGCANLEVKAVINHWTEVIDLTTPALADDKTMEQLIEEDMIELEEGEQPEPLVLMFMN